MNRIALALPVAIAAALAAYSPPARADLAPPPVFAPACTLEAAQAAGEPCQRCDADFLDADACTRALGPQGLALRCRAPGLTAWTEVWCRGPAAPAASPSASATAPPAAAPAASASAPAPPSPAASARGGDSTDAPRSTCAFSAPAASPPAIARLGLALAALALLARRRLRTPARPARPRSARA